MDPVELFRLRCLREAEEKFRQGLLPMQSEPKKRSDKSWFLMGSDLMIRERMGECMDSLHKAHKVPL